MYFFGVVIYLLRHPLLQRGGGLVGYFQLVNEFSFVCLDGIQLLGGAAFDLCQLLFGGG